MMVAISSLLLAFDSIDELSKSMDPEIKCKCAIPKRLRFSNWLTESLSKGKLIHEAVVQLK